MSRQALAQRLKVAHLKPKSRKQRAMATNTAKVRAWYDEHVEMEDKRLDMARVEKAITLTITERLIDAVKKDGQTESVRIADVGCGTGRYAIPLASKGHALWICDISRGEVDLAESRAKQANVSFRASVAFDARELREHEEIFQADFYHLSMFLGPFYHLLEAKERIDLMVTGLNMTRPGGFVAAAFVTRNAHLRDVASRDPTRLFGESAFYRPYLANGRYTRGTAAPMYHASLEEVNELLDAVREKSQEQGIVFEVVQRVSCEGFLGFQHASHLAGLGDEEFEEWLQLLLQSASAAETLGCADHVLVVLKRLR